MRYSLLLSACLILPTTVMASGETFLASLRGIPDDFRRYFFHSELPVQVRLNDQPLFEASMSVRENGSMNLISILVPGHTLAPEVQTRWENVLRQGISVGECETRCPNGLITTEYKLDSSTLQLYTSNYETARAETNYITLPETFSTGLIIHNDFSAVQTSSDSQLYSLNSAWQASFLNWNHRMAFQSSYSSDKYGYDSTDLYELFSQKELAGSFIRLGFFTPDSETGNVQTTAFGYDSVIGAMWGTSDTLLENNNTVSAWPVYINGRNQAIAEVYRDGRLIHTQQLQDGVQALDTRRLPGGIYDITIRVMENGQEIDTQTAQIYKPSAWLNTDRRWRMNLWTGQRHTVSSRDTSYRDESLVVGGSLDVLAWPGGIVGLSATTTEDHDHWLRLRSDITLTPSDSLFLQHTRAAVGDADNNSSDVRYYRTLTGGNSASLYWRNTEYDYRTATRHHRQRGDVWGSSFSLRLPGSSNLIFNGQYADSAWRRGFSADASFSTRRTWFNRDTDIRLSAYDRPGYQGQRRDQGGSVNITLSLFPDSRHHSVSAALGVNDRHGYTSASYQWRPQEDSNISWLGGGVSHSHHHTTLSANGGIDNRYLNGDGYVQYATADHNTTAGLNLSQSLAVGGGRIAAGNLQRGLQSAVIVDVQSDQPDNQIIAAGRMSEMNLQAGRNVIPVDTWQRDTLQFSARGDNGVQIYPAQHHVQMNKGSVGYVQVKAVNTRTLVAILRDEQGNKLRNRAVSSDTGNGRVNADGVLTLDISQQTRTLHIAAENGSPALVCPLPATNITGKQKVQFENHVLCKESKL